MASGNEGPTNAQSESEMNKHLGELESVKTEEELEKKIDGMKSVGLSIASWMKYMFNKGNDQPFKAEWLTIDEYKTMAQESMHNAFKTINLPNWRLEKKGSQKGDVVESHITEQFGKVHRFTGIVDCPALFLYEQFKNNVTELPKWNPTILKSELVKEIGPGIDISYQVTAGGGRGMIAPRDFVILRRMAALSKDGKIVENDPHCYIASGVSVQVPGYPPVKDIVRGHNKVGCWYLIPKAMESQGGKIEQRTIFQWLMCCDLKSNIPQFVLDTAFSTVMLDYIVHVRKFVAESKAKGLF